MMATASPLPGFSSSGTHFVVAIPQLGYENKEVIKIYFTTYEMKATVTISEPPTALFGKKPNDEILILRRFERVSYSLSRFHVLRIQGIYKAIVIKASAPVRVYVRITSEITVRNALFDLLPYESCSRVYYVTARPSDPFVSIITFDHETKLRIIFSDFSQSFTKSCHADKSCEPGQEVSIQLEKYGVWFFFIKGKGFRLDNTLIEADYPVFVISGNINCLSAMFEPATCMTSCTPHTAWGKEYFVPIFMKKVKGINSLTILHVTTEKVPLRLTFFNRSSIEVKTMQSFKESHFFNLWRDPVIISSNTAFGVTMVYSSFIGNGGRCQFVDLLEVIPVERWLSGAIRTVKSEDVFKCTAACNTLVVSTGKHVISPEIPLNQKWESMNSNNYSYNFVRLMLPAGTFRIFTEEPNKKVMVYLLLDGRKEGSSPIRALDFNQGEIHTSDCKNVEPVESDGVDNDCDGVVDEEFKNDKDDDGDGRVDEDTILPPGKSEWTQWVKYCSIMCNERTIVRKVRSCRISYYLAETCKGRNESCYPAPSCPDRCNDMKLQQECKCAIGCAQCDTKTGACQFCKPGYLASDYCMSRCPKGWAGSGCEKVGHTNYEEEATDRKHSADNKEEESTMSSDVITGIVVLVGCLLLIPLVVFLFCVVLRRKKATPDSAFSEPAAPPAVEKNADEAVYKSSYESESSIHSGTSVDPEESSG